MKLIIGGAFQGKKEYASQQFGVLPQQWTDGAGAAYEEIYTCTAMNHFHEWVKNRMEEGQDLTELVSLLEEKNPDILLVTTELGYGVVPMEAFDRAWREMTGRVCIRIAAKSEMVVRVVCGIGTVLKA